MVVNFYGDQIFVDFVRFLIHEVLYAQCLRHNICIAYVAFRHQNTMASNYNPIECGYGLWQSHLARPFSVPGVIASSISCMEEGVVIQMWNYMLQCLPIFKTAITYCLLYCFIALQASAHIVLVYGLYSYHINTTLQACTSLYIA